MSKHAMLSASGASRWLTCTPSAKLELSVPEVESSYADEGTLAHKIAEFRIKEIAYGIDLQKHILKLQEDELYSPEMTEFIEEYATFVVDQVREAKEGAILMQEHRLSLHKYIPEGFGTVDNCIISPGVLEIIDLKYGKGIPVDAYQNEQLKVYALGALEDAQMLFEIDVVRMVIYQPRIGNISTFEMSVEDLLIWAREVLKPTAIIAFQGSGELVAGDHCRFCRIRSTCKANAKMNLQLAAREFDIATVSDEQVVKVLQRIGRMKNWLNSVEEYAMRMALQGKKWPGMKLVQGRSVRKYVDEETIYNNLIEAGYGEEKLIKKKMVGITELTKLVKKPDFKELVEPHLIKPPGAPTLVEDTDGRPEWNRLEDAKSDFDE